MQTAENVVFIFMTIKYILYFHEVILAKKIVWKGKDACMLSMKHEWKNRLLPAPKSYELEMRPDLELGK
jgi:hypothetical protein